jgi:Tol biopolymer transport system component
VARSIVFVAPERSPVQVDLWLLDVHGGPPRRLTADRASAADPTWTPDGRWIVFSSKRAGSQTLWRIPAGGGEPQPLTAGAGQDTSPRISADGRRLVYGNVRESFALSWLDPRTGARRELVERREVVSGPSFSPDGRQLVFFGGERRDVFLYLLDLTDGSIRQLTSGPGLTDAIPTWTADGRRVVFYRAMPRPDLLALDLARGTTSAVAAGFDFARQHGAQLDPSGRLLAYTLRGDGWRSRVRDLSSGAEHGLARDLLWPRWSPDGKDLAGRDLEGNLFLCPGDGSPPCRWLARKANEPRWSGGWVYFLAFPGEIETIARSVELRRVRTDGSGEEHVADLAGPHPVHFFYDVSRTGEVVWSEYKPSPSELWTAELPAD